METFNLDDAISKSLADAVKEIDARTDPEKSELKEASQDDNKDSTSLKSVSDNLSESSPADTSDEDTDVSAESSSEDDEDTDDTPDDSDDESEKLSPPERWSSEHKETFNALPKEAQKVLLDREADVQRYLTKQTQALSEEKKRIADLDTLLQPRRPIWESQGITEKQAVDFLFERNDFANRDPAGFVKWFAERVGLDLASITGAQPVGSSSENAAVQQQMQKLRALESEVITLRKQQEAVTAAQTSEIIEAFATEKDGSGNLLRPYFEEVREDMSKLIGSGAAVNLDQAYKLALVRNQEVSERIRLEQEAHVAKIRASAAKEALRKAKQAGGVQVKQKDNVVYTSKPPANWEDTVDSMAAKIRR